VEAEVLGQDTEELADDVWAVGGGLSGGGEMDTLWLSDGQVPNGAASL